VAAKAPGPQAEEADQEETEAEPEKK
jgi:hypothetical protein